MVALTPPRPPVLIDLEIDGGTAFVGTWFPLTIRLRRPLDQKTPVRVRNVDCADKDVQIDSDFLQRDVEVRPGESYRFTMLLKVASVRELELATICLELAEVDDLVPLPSRLVQVRPALGRDVVVSDEPICSYGDTTKVLLTFHHEGQTAYRNLRIHIGPEAAVRSGKWPIVRLAFGPGDVETAIVAATGDLKILMSAVVDGADVRSERSVAVKPVTAKVGQLFRFLEPSRLSSDQIVLRAGGRGGPPVGLVRSAYPLVGGGSYQVVIRPQNAAEVKDIKLQDIPGLIYVRKAEFEAEENGWTFDIDVIYSELVSKPDRLVYRVETRTGLLTGEIHLALKPPHFKYLKFSVALGLAATLQGATALVRRALDPERSILDGLTDFDWHRDYQFLFLLSIPVVWAGTLLADWLQYRLRN